MSSIRITHQADPVADLITLAQAKEQLRIELSFVDDDVLLGRLIKTATQHIEAMTNRALVNRTVSARCDAFPSATGNVIELRLGVVQSIVSLKYSDVDGVEQTLPTTDYKFEQELQAIVFPAYGKSWPVTRCEPGAVRIEYVAGYGPAAADVPEGLLHAALLLVAHWYENAEPVNIGNISTTLPFAVDALTAHYAIPVF